jgi:cellular nucleic acid-binding protein
MGRRAGIAMMSSGMAANPYARPKDQIALITLCELCDIQMKTKDWNAHKNSKKHRAEETKEQKKNNPAANSSGDDGGFSVDNPTGNGGFGDGFGASYSGGGSDDRACLGCGETGHTKRECPSGGSDGQACYGCGEEGHQKRDCPHGAGGQACFNCGNVG